MSYGAAFGNAQISGDVTQARGGIPGDAQQRSPVVGEKGPVGHSVTPSRLILEINCYIYNY